MENRIMFIRKIIILFIFSFSSAIFLFPEEASEFVFKYSEDKKPLFLQKICWDGSKYAIKYYVTVKDSNDNILVNKYTDVPSIDCSLEAGEYYYKVISFNVLGQPEQESEWIPIIVEKAYLPIVTSVSINTLYIEKYYGDPIVIYGRDFTDRVTVHLKDLVAHDRPVIKGSIIEHDNGKIVVKFKMEDLTKGAYDLIITNPGNVYAVKPFEVKYVKAVDILLTGGYSPLINGYSGDFNQLLLGVFYPIGFKTDASFFFFKTKYGFFGIGASSDISYFHDTKNVSLYGIIFKNSLSIDYLYQFNKIVGVLPKIGGGMALSAMLFDYGNEELNRNTATFDPFITTGVALQIRPYRFVSILVGADYSQIFYKDSTFGMVKPYISAGYQF